MESAFWLNLRNSMARVGIGVAVFGLIGVIEAVTAPQRSGELPVGLFLLAAAGTVGLWLSLRIAFTEEKRTVRLILTRSGAITIFGSPPVVQVTRNVSVSMYESLSTEPISTTYVRETEGVGVLHNRATILRVPEAA